MCSVAERKIAAIVGACVADAAAQPLHWIYNASKLASIVGTKEDVEFHEPSENPYYSIATGRNSCYGDQIFVLLQSLVAQSGYNRDDYAERMFKHFGPDSEYDNPVNSAYMPKSGVKCSYPIDGPWKHTSLKHFEKNYSEDKEETGSQKDTAADCFVKIIPLVALYAGKPELLDKVEDCISTTQSCDITVAIGMAAARFLEYCILTGHLDGGLEAVMQQLNDPKRFCPHDFDPAIATKLKMVANVKDQPHAAVSRNLFAIS